MIGTYVSAALICAASLLVGQALLRVAGRDAWSWTAPAAGFGAVLTVTGVLARAPGHGTSATLGLVLLIVIAAAIVAPRPQLSRQALREGAPAALVVVLVLSIPFAITARWGLLGVGFNNDLGLHLAWAEWLRSGAGPTPEPGYPLGPHGLSVAVAAVPGISLGQAFVGQIFAIGILTALTALAALPDLRPPRRLLAATFVAVSYLGASYFAQGAFKETAEALFVLAFAVVLLDPGQQPRGAVVRLRFLLPYLALAGGIFFAYSFAGLAWPVAILALWSLTLPPVRAALAPRALLRLLLRPATVAAIAILAGLAVAVTLVGPFGFVHGFNKVAGTNTYGPVSPVEALGVWPTSNYRLDAPGDAPLAGLAGAVSALAVLLGVVWWARRRELAVPIGLAACAVLYAASLPFSGDYSQAKALMIAAPLAMLVAIRPLLVESTRRGRARGRARGRGYPRDAGVISTAPPSSAAPPGSTASPGSAARLGWAVLAALFVGGAAYSSFLALREAPVGPAGHGGELRTFLPIVHGQPVLYAGQDRYAAYELLGADTHVPIVEFPDAEVSENPEKPFDTGDAYSPIDFDSFSRGTLNRFPYVITGRAAWNSQAPPNFRRADATESYLLWKRTGPTPSDRHVLLEGTDAAAKASCASPEIRILLGSGGRTSLLPTPAIARKDRWEGGNVLGGGETTSQTVRLPAGRWHLSLQYFSPVELLLSAPGFHETLQPALDGQRPNTISLANDGQFWPAGTLASGGGAVRFTIAAAEPTTLQRLSGYAGKAQLGDLVAVPATPHRLVPLGEACEGWIDWYESSTAP